MGMARETPNRHRYGPKPQPRTIADLYRDETGDTDPHHRSIDAHFKKLPKQTQAMMRDRAAGKTFDQIAAKHKVTRGGAGSRLQRALQRIRLAIAKAPRYWITGRGAPDAQTADAPTPAEIAEAKQIASDAPAAEETRASRRKNAATGRAAAIEPIREYDATRKAAAAKKPRPARRSK
jgi:hypothetical protein